MQTLDELRAANKYNHLNHFCQNRPRKASSASALSRMAFLANILAKQLDGQGERELAYRIKTEACDLLIISGTARVNSVSVSGETIGLTIDGECPRRMHVPRRHLCHEARAIVNKQIRELAAALIHTSPSDLLSTIVSCTPAGS
jgi:hypothetical protein